MADTKPETTGANSAPAASKPPPNAAPKPPNPALKAMGLGFLRAKLPSRNWLIFFGIVGSWSAAVYYDRREKKRIQKRWSDVVSHLAREPLPPSMQPRKLTIFLSAPPADGLLEAREHFHEYVRPILSSAGLDWDAVEGRREGDVRAELAERIRKRRKMAGEGTIDAIPEDDVEVLIDGIRSKMGVKEWDGVQGDIVIGRNTWKEYVRGLHEGWLGPVDMPEDVKKTMEELDKPAVVVEEAKEELAKESVDAASKPDASLDDADQVPSASEEQPKIEEEEKPKEEPVKPKKPRQPLPFISTSDYASAAPPRSLPSELGPSAIITFPHILGFLNTYIRIYRYLNKRKVADDIGREVVAACFAVYRPYERTTPGSGISPFKEDSTSLSVGLHQEESTETKGGWEQEILLQKEELEWHKSVRKDREEAKESVWLDPMSLDPRIAGRMRRFYLDEEDVRKGEVLAKGMQDGEDS